MDISLLERVGKLPFLKHSYGTHRERLPYFVRLQAQSKGSRCLCASFRRLC